MTDEVIETQSVVGEPGPEARDRSHGGSWKRWLLLGCAGFVGLCLLYYAVTLIQVVRAGRTTDPDPAEAIVVLGAAQYDGRPSPQLASRLDHALELYEAGLAPVVMVTGGNQPGDRFTEAEASANYLVDRGVPESAIMREDAGHTTFESLAAAADQRRDRLVVIPSRAGGGCGCGGGTDHRVRSVDRPDRVIRPWGRLTRAVHSSLAPMGCGVTGNTADSGSVIQGSIPCTPTNRPRRFT